MEKGKFLDEANDRRRRLPDERAALTHHFTVGGLDGYIIIGFYDDGTPGELFVKVAKEGSTVSGLLDAIGILTSLSLQHGVPLLDITRKLRGMSFEPSGFTPNAEIRQASSLVDYIFHFLELKYGGEPRTST